MAQVTIKTSKENRFKRQAIIGDKKVKFDEFGMAEIPERYVESILENDASISLVDEADIKKYAELKEKIEENKEIPNVDLREENKALVKRNSQLEEVVQDLTKKNKELEDELANIKPEEDTKVSKDTEENVDEDISIDNLKKPELLGVCKESNLPEEEWKDLKVDELRKYVNEKV